MFTFESIDLTALPPQQWLTTHEPSVEHDLSTGLREHFDPRARWRFAIASARAIHRLNSFKRSSTKSSSATANDDDSDDDDDGHHHNHTLPLGSTGSTGSVLSPIPKMEDPGSNEFVNVIAPEEEEDGLREKKKERVKTLPVEDNAKPVHTGTAPPIIDDDKDVAGPIFTDGTSLQLEPESMTETEEPIGGVRAGGNEDDDEPRMPGSFDLLPTSHSTTQKQASWAEMLKKLYV